MPPHVDLSNHRRAAPGELLDHHLTSAEAVGLEASCSPWPAASAVMADAVAQDVDLICPDQNADRRQHWDLDRVTVSFRGFYVHLQQSVVENYPLLRHAFSPLYQGRKGRDCPTLDSREILVCSGFSPFLPKIISNQYRCHLCCCVPFFLGGAA